MSARPNPAAILARAFGNSLRGIGLAARTERAVRQELAVLAVAVPTACLVSPEPWTRLALIGVLVLLLAIEFLNTALERFCDHVTPEHHEAIGAIKDLGSAAVLCGLALAGAAWGLALWQALAR